MTLKQKASWAGLLDMAERTTNQWTLVGGQMVHLHCTEHGIFPVRPTHDVDTGLDLRGHPGALREITQVLTDLGFVASIALSVGGAGHRWTRGDATNDVLIPGYLGSVKRDIHGAVGLEAPGVQQALDRSEVVEVNLDGRIAKINRPSLLEALIGKAAALEILVDNGRSRHLEDFAVLASIVRVGDIPPAREMRKLDISRLENAIGVLRTRNTVILQTIDGAEEGIARIASRLTSREISSTKPAKIRRTPFSL